MILQDSPQMPRSVDGPNYAPYCHREWALRKWTHLKFRVPLLRRLKDRYYRPGVPPRPVSDGLFLALCASFADPTKREILRGLILDLLADDLAELLSGMDAGGEI